MRDGQPNPCSVRESAYDALVETSPKYQEEAEYDDRATWSNPCGVFSSFMFLQGRLAMPLLRRGCLGTRHSSFLRRGVSFQRRGIRGWKIVMSCEVICGNESLDCTAVVGWVKQHPDCSKDELMNSRLFCDLVKAYSEKIKVQHELSWAQYEWFADVVLGQFTQNLECWACSSKRLFHHDERHRNES